MKVRNQRNARESENLEGEKSRNIVQKSEKMGKSRICDPLKTAKCSEKFSCVQQEFFFFFFFSRMRGHVFTMGTFASEGKCQEPGAWDIKNKTEQSQWGQICRVFCFHFHFVFVL